MLLTLLVIPLLWQAAAATPPGTPARELEIRAGREGIFAVRPAFKDGLSQALAALEARTADGSVRASMIRWAAIGNAHDWLSSWARAEQTAVDRRGYADVGLQNQLDVMIDAAEKLARLLPIEIEALRRSFRGATDAEQQQFGDRAAVEGSLDRDRLAALRHVVAVVAKAGSNEQLQRISAVVAGVAGK